MGTYVKLSVFDSKILRNNQIYCLYTTI